MEEEETVKIEDREWKKRGEGGMKMGKNGSHEEGMEEVEMEEEKEMAEMKMEEELEKEKIEKEAREVRGGGNRGGGRDRRWKLRKIGEKMEKKVE